MKAWALAALPALVWPGVAAARFAPVEGVTYRYTVTDEREAGRFTSERRIVFRRAGDGWTADLTVVSAAATGDRDVTAMSRVVLPVLVGKTIRYQLSDTGAVVAVADQDRLMTLVVDAVGALAGKRATAVRTAAVGQVAKTFATMAPDMQRTLLASLISPIIAGAQSDAPAGQRPLALSAGSAMAPGAAELTGTETVVRDDTRVAIDTMTEGPAPTTGAMMRIVQRREIDAKTGIVLVNDRRTETWLTAAPDKRQVATSTAKVTF